MEHEVSYMTHVKPGSRERITWKLTHTGNFEFACLVADHFEAGMKEVIVVAANQRHEKHTMKRRTFVGGAVATAAWLAGPRTWAQAGTSVEVWKDPNCGCCKDRITHMQSNGFIVRSHDSGNAAARPIRGSDGSPRR